MAIKILFNVILLVVHCLLMFGVLRIVRKRCEFPVRILIAAWIGIVAGLLIDEFKMGEFTLVMASIITIICATTAYAYSVTDRLFVVALGICVTAVPYVLLCVTHIQILSSKYGFQICFVALEAVIYCFAKIVAAYIHRSYKNSRENQAFMQQLDYYKRQMLVMNACEAELRGLRHDMKNHFNVLSDMVRHDKKQDALDYIDSLYDVTRGRLNLSRSGNFEIDSIVNAKLDDMKQKNITCEHSIMVPEYLDVNSTDLVIIIGNLLDNAIRCVERLAAEESERVQISIVISYDRGNLNICITNICDTDAKEYYYDSDRDNKVFALLDTDKEDRKNHGIGLKNVVASVKKYDGVVTIKRERGIFSVNVSMC